MGPLLDRPNHGDATPFRTASISDPRYRTRAPLRRSRVCWRRMSAARRWRASRSWTNTVNGSKPRIGVSVTETSRAVSFCAHAIEQQDLFIVSDTLQDERFRENPAGLWAARTFVSMREPHWSHPTVSARDLVRHRQPIAHAEGGSAGSARRAPPAGGIATGTAAESYRAG